MHYVKGLRWRILALMLVGTIIVYVDRNVLGVLAPILKKELNFTTEQYSFVVSSFQRNRRASWNWRLSRSTVT